MSGEVQLLTINLNNHRELVGTGIKNDNDWLYSHSEEQVTYQLIVLNDESKTLELLDTLEGNGQIFSTLHNNTPVFYILWGSFTDKQSAMAYRDSLPEWATQVELIPFTILQNNRCKKRRWLQPGESKGLEEYCRS